VSDIPRSLREAVVLRANDRCEYCRLAQVGQEAAFHIDHVTPQVVGGPTVLENLALAWVSCSLRKAARQVAIDPISGEDVPLFNPRNQSWHEHFYWNSELVIGLTATGRATVIALAMNRPVILAIRGEEALRGRHP
jgi:hypothetical protein